MSKVVTVNEKDPNITTYHISYTFDYEYDGIPQDMILYFNSTFPSKKPNVSVQMITPDGRKLRIADIGLDSQQTFRFSQDEKLQQRLKTDDVMTGIFAAPDSPTHAVLKGNYQLVISGLTFEKNSDINVEFLQLGRVYGIAGTDMYRRDLLIPLLWGAPIALAFGLIASIGTSVLTLLISAIGAWYGKWVDALIQRITEINYGVAFPFDLDHDWHFLQSQHLDHSERHDPAEYFHRRNQELSRKFHTDQGIHLCRSSACVRRQRHAHRVPLFDSPNDSPPSSHDCVLSPLLCFP